MNHTYILILVNFFNFSKGEGIASSSFILFFYLYWYSYILYFVCDSASEFGAMGSTSFLGFSSPIYILILVNLFNFFKGGGDSFLVIYFILSPVLVSLYNNIFCL